MKIGRIKDYGILMQYITPNDDIPSQDYPIDWKMPRFDNSVW